MFKILERRGGKHVGPGKDPFHRRGEIFLFKLLHESSGASSSSKCKVQNIDVAPWERSGQKVIKSTIHRTCKVFNARYLKAYTDTERDPWEGCSVR